MSEKPTVAILGLGTMGAGMAHSLLRGGFSPRLYNRNPKRFASFENSAAVLCTSAREAASGADIVIGMVSDDPASRSLWQGGEGALASARAGAILVECSTLSLGWVRELSGLAIAQGCQFLDAPVGGSKVHAETGALKFMVGGDPDVVAKATPVLTVMGTDIIPVGPVGSGTILKLVNNFICGVQVASFAEGLAMLERCGLAQPAALAVITKGAPGSPLIQTIAARIAAQDYTPNFSISLIAKDLAYAAREGAAAGVELTAATAARARFLQAESIGLGEQDIASVIEFLRQPSSK